MKNEGLMSCGHPLSAVISGDEGTCFCAECEREARATPTAWPDLYEELAAPEGEDPPSRGPAQP